MSSALQTAVNGINNYVAKATQAAASIVNASSTSGDIDANLVKITTERTNVVAEAAVIKADNKEKKSLIDITV